MENRTNFFPSFTPSPAIKDMPQFHHHPSPFYSSELPELNSFFTGSDPLDLENTATTAEVIGQHCNNNNLSAPAAGEFFNVDDLFVEGHCETAQFYFPSTTDQSTDNNNVWAAPAPMIYSDVANPFLVNPTAEPTVEFGAAVSSPERESAPRDGAVAARKVWTVHEHKLFLVGMHIYGKSDWKNIANKVVMTKTPTQVASHAQKYFLRQQSAGQKRKRSRLSIHDITTVDPQLLLQVVLAGQQPPPPPWPPLLTNYPLPPMLPHHTQPPPPVWLPQQFGAPGDQEI